jgi:predicted Zn-dependent peptidase
MFTNRLKAAARFAAAALLLASALPIAAPAQVRRNVRVDFKQTTLKNGLRVITVEDRSAPVVALALAYDVGSRNEREGRTGFAHLFEHMMFKGSANVGSREHNFLIANSGGTMNGTTNVERTLYFEAVPSNQLELILFLEADRMRSLEVNQANFDNQREVVKEERRLRLDNEPYGKSGERLRELMYDNFAYKHSVIGSMADLDAASVEDARQFFRTFYAPNNAVLVLVGDFSTADVLARVRRHFEGIPRQPAPATVNAAEPEQKSERRDTIEDPLARLARVVVAFKTAPANTADHFALRVLSAALQSGQSSRLYQRLVKDREMVTGVGGFVEESRGAGMFAVQATVRPGVKPEEVEAAVYEEVERLKREPIADWELEKAINTARAQFINSLETSLARANQIAEFAVYFGDPGLINTLPEKIAAVTKDDVRRVAEKYLRETNRTVVVTVPKAGPRPAAASGR